MFDRAEWGATVAGAWNPAILTPTGVRERFFHASRETPIAVEVNIDEPQPLRVRHDGITVVVGSDRLVAATEEPTLANLRRACLGVKDVLASLNQTPVRGAGVNLRFSGQPGDVALSERFAAPIDETFEAEFTLGTRMFMRSLQVGDGVLNLEVRTENDQMFVSFNYHLQSGEHAALIRWLDRVDEFHRQTFQVLDLLGASVKGGKDD